MELTVHQEETVMSTGGGTMVEIRRVLLETSDHAMPVLDEVLQLRRLDSFLACWLTGCWCL
jgi:hypothetical protein